MSIAPETRRKKNIVFKKVENQLHQTILKYLQRAYINCARNRWFIILYKLQ